MFSVKGNQLLEVAAGSLLPIPIYIQKEVMVPPDRTDKDGFLYPRSRYYGQVRPENLVFNANLQEFAHKVTYICNLETAGKISAEESYNQIEVLWKELKRSKKQLRIGEHTFENGVGTD